MTGSASLILAALLGGFTSSVVTVATKGMEYRRDDHARWVGERRDAYIGLVKESEDMCVSFLLGSMGTDPAHELSSGWLQDGQEAVRKFREHADVIELLAPDDVVVAVVTLRNAVDRAAAQAIGFEIGRVDFPSEDVTAATAAIHPCREEVIRKARMDLKIRRRVRWWRR